jgi:hypothetical protein
MRLITNYVRNTVEGKKYARWNIFSMKQYKYKIETNILQIIKVFILIILI